MLSFDPTDQKGRFSPANGNSLWFASPRAAVNADAKFALRFGVNNAG